LAELASEQLALEVTEVTSVKFSIPSADLNLFPQTEISIAYVDVSKDTNVPAAIVHRTPPQTWQRPKDEVTEPQKPNLIEVPAGVLESPFAALATLYKIQGENAKGKLQAMLVNGEPIGDLG